MLDAMRSGSKNIFVKAFLSVLALSFVVWGVGDVFRGRTSNTVATIGDTELSYYEYNNSLRREVTRYQQILGRSLTEEQIEKFNIKSMVLNQLIDNKLIKKRIGELGFRVGNEVAMEQILSSSAFEGEGGEFDEGAFRSILRSNGINEDEYIAMLKQDAAMRLFLDSFAAYPATMEMRAKALYEYRNEKRIADVLHIPASYKTEIKEPSEEDLVQYYQENNAKFSIPEMREVTYLTLGVDNIQNDLNISEDELRIEYENNIENYMQPAMRVVDQYLFDSEDAVKKASADMMQGQFQKFADKKMSMGQVSKEGLPEEVRETIFSLSKNQISEPIKTDLGWHIFMVSDVVDARTMEFNEVKKTLEEEIMESRASDVFFEFANQVEDSFAAGLSVEEVAEKFGVIIHKSPAVDNVGNDSKGNEVKLPEKETFLPLAFSTEKGLTSPLTLLSDNVTYVVLRADTVAEQRVKALDEVKGTAIDMWKRDEKSNKLKELANDIADKAKEGESIAKLAKEMKLTLKKSIELIRPEKDSFLDGDGREPVMLVKDLFSLQEGEATGAYKNSEGGFSLAVLNKIENAEMKDSEIRKIENQLKEDFVDDTLSQYNVFLRKEYPITVNKTLLNDASSL